jgi:hypothetical protein
MLALLDRTWRGGRVRLLELNFEFQLYALRDELRESAVAGDIEYNNWFDYMDTTITRTIERVDNVNPWIAVGYLWLNKNNQEALMLASKELRTVLSSPENKKLGEIYAEFNKLVKEFLKSRFRLSWPLAAIVAGAMCRGENKKAIHDSISEEEKRLAPVFSITPQTSTYWEYSPSVSHMDVAASHAKAQLVAR